MSDLEEKDTKSKLTELDHRNQWLAKDRIKQVNK